MNFAQSTAVAAVLALGLGTAAPALAKKSAPAQAGPQYSAPFRQAMQPLQKAMQANDFAGAKAVLPAAQAAASTPDDKLQAGLSAVQIGSRTGDVALQNSGADLVIASGKATPEQLTVVANVRGVNAYNAGDLATADAAFTQEYQANPADTDNAILLAQTKVRERQPQAALPIVDKAIGAKQAANQPVPEDWIRRALGIAYDAKLPAETIRYGQLLVTTVPNTETWRTAIQTYRDTSPLDAQSTIDALRLARAANALAGERDYYEYANAVNDKGFPGEAKAVIDEGMASNMVDRAVKSSKALAEIKTLATPKIAADKASLPALDKSARAAADGKKALNTGDAYLGYGMYGQAADLYKVALQKGGVDANIANLHLGEALARSGQQAAAVQAFASVTGPRQPLAVYWTIWTNQGAKPAAAPAARAPAAS